MRIKFIKSPTGLFKMAYSSGAEVIASANGVTPAQCEELIAAGVAIKVDEPKAAPAVKKPKAKSKSSKK